MRKFLITIFTLLILGLLAPLTVGYFLKKEITSKSSQWIQQFTRLPITAATITNYHEGWFASSFDANLQFPNTTVTLNNIQLKHGPLLFFKDVKNMHHKLLGWTFLHAAIPSTLFPLAISTQNKIAMDMVVNFIHGSHFLYMLPQGSYHSTDISCDWQAAEVMDTVYKKNQSIDAYAILTNASVSKMPQHLQFTSSDLRLYFRFNQQKNKDQWQGRALLSAAKFHLQSPQSIEISDIQWFLNFNIFKNTVSSSMNLYLNNFMMPILTRPLKTVMNINVANLSINPFQSLISINNLNRDQKNTATTFQNLIKQFTLNSIFLPGSLSKIQLWLSSSTGTLQIQGFLQSQKNIKANLSIQAPIKFIESIYVAKSAEQTDLLTTLNNWQTSGIVVKDTKGNYQTKIDFDQGQLTINGKAGASL